MNSRVLWLCVGLVLVDGLMTLPHWQLEGNPIVLALGPVGMLMVKCVAVSALVFVWTRIDGIQDSLIARASLTSLTGLYALVVLTNGIVLVA